MIGSENSQTIFDLERRVLRALCSEQVAPALQCATLQELHNHDWQYPEHRIVYDALAALGGAASAAPRERLPAQASRMGFPDVDWDLYFKREEGLGENLTTVLRQLMRATGETR